MIYYKGLIRKLKQYRIVSSRVCLCVQFVQSVKICQARNEVDQNHAVIFF